MKLFISYSRDDAGNFAKHIHKFMRNKGHDVFIDVNSITIGDPWARSIEKNISECDLFVVILTPDAISSSYVEKEILQAQKQNKIIVPCIHEHVEYDEIKWGLADNQGIEFSDRYELALNLYPKIKNYENKVDEKPSFQGEVIQDTNISEDTSSLNDKGLDLYNQGKYYEAIEWFDKAIEVDPNYLYALYNKGLAFFNQDKYKEAIESFDKALEIDPNYIDALQCKGITLAAQGEYKEALEWYDKALEIDPNDKDVLNGKGDALAAQGEYEEAIEWYDKALEVDPNFTSAQDNKRLALDELSKENSSISSSDTSSYYEDANSLNDKGLDLYNKSKYKEAIEWYDKALEVDPNCLAALFNKGLSLYYLGKHEEAIEWYDKALEVDPNNLDTLNNKGISLKNLGKYEEAIECYDKALEVDPNYTKAQNNKKIALNLKKSKKGFFGFRKKGYVNIRDLK